MKNQTLALIIALAFSGSLFSQDQTQADPPKKKSKLVKKHEASQKQAAEAKKQLANRKKSNEEIKQEEKTKEQLGETSAKIAELQGEVSDLLDSSSFGHAIITFVRNNTLYPMSIALKREKENLLDQLPENTIIRIKSLKGSYGETGKYFSFKEVGNFKVLKADTIDPTSAATDFMVKKYKHVKSGESFLGLVLPDQQDVMLVGSKTNQVQLGPSSGGFRNEKGKDAQWTIEGSRLEVCYLKNRLSGGILGALGGEIDFSDDFPPKTPKISWKGVSGQKGQLQIPDLESGLGEGAGLPVSELVWRANKAREHLLNSKFSDSRANNVFSNYLKQAKTSRTAFSARENPEPVRYGDRIKITHTRSMQGLFAGTSAHPGGTSGQASVFCSNSDAQDQVKDELSSWWIIKGPHHSTDRFNCQLGSAVQMGDTIRLENCKTGKNLSAKKLSSSHPKTFETDILPDDFMTVEVFSAGQDGIGSEHDNLIISPLEGIGDQLWKGREFILTHALSMHQLHSINSFFSSREAQGPLQKVVGLKRADEGPKTDMAADPSKLMESAGSSDAMKITIKTTTTTGPTTVKKDGKEVTNQKTEPEEDTGQFGISDKKLAEIEAAQKKATKTASEQSKKMSRAPVPEFIEKSMGWFVSSNVPSSSPKNDVAWTGYPGGAAFEEEPDQRTAIEIVKLGMDSTIQPGETLAQKIQVSSENPNITGFASQKIEPLGRDTLINLPPMLGKGIAWVNQTISTPGQFSVSFLGQTIENGRIEVILGENVDLSWLYKISIGSGGGRKTSIIKREFKEGKAVENEVFTIDKDENYLAAIRSGKFTPYWVSFNNGEISQGYGLTPGKNIVASWKDPSMPKKPYRIGFGSFREPSSYTGFTFGQAVKVGTPSKTLATIDKTFNLSGGSQEWVDKPLRVPGTGTISFWAEGKDDVILILSESEEPGSQQYAVRINATDSKMEVLEWQADKGKYEKTLDSGSQDEFRINAGRRHLWVSFDDEQIFLGAGKQFQSLKLTRPKNKKLSNFLSVGFMCKEGSAKVGDIKISSPVRLEKVDVDSDKQADWKGLLEKDSLFVISPFDYAMAQSGPSIRFKDEISGTSQFVGKATSKGTTYEFIMAIEKDGLPKMTWTREPENAAKLRLKVLGKAMRGAGQSIFLASSYMESAGQQAFDDISDGKIETGSTLAATSSVATTGLGLRVSRLGMELEAMAKFGDKSVVSSVDRSYGTPMLKHKENAAHAYQDKTSQKKKADSSIPLQAQKNRWRLEQEMSMGQKWIASDPQRLTRLLALYKKVIGLIIHPHVVEQAQTKASVIENLESLYQAHEEFFGSADQIDTSFGIMLDLLLTAYTNPYLIDPNTDEGEQLMQTLISRVSTLAGKMLSIDGWLDLPALQNMPLWLEQGLPEESRGIVEFSAKGQGDLMVSLTQDVVDVRAPAEGYTVFFGGKDNSQIQIRVKGFVKPVAVFEDDDVLNQIVNKKFWIKLDGAKISVGKDEPSQDNTLVEWTDPYPPGAISFLSLSTKQMPATIEGFSVKPLEEVAL